MFEAEDYFIPIIWEGDGDHPSPNYAGRDGEYNVTALPSTAVGGDNFDLGGGTGVLGRYQALYNTLVTVEAPMDLTVGMNVNDGGEVEISADVLITDTFPVDDYRIIYLLTYYYSDSYNSTVVKYYEEEFTLSEVGETGQFVYAFDLPTGLDLASSRAVVLVQSVNSTGVYPDFLPDYSFNMYPILQAGYSDFPLGAPNPITDIELEFNGNAQFDLTDYFYYNGEPVNAELTVVSSDPSVVSADLYGTILDLNAYDNGGNIQIDILGSYEGYNAVSTFHAMVVAGSTEIPYAVEDSPDQQVYPNNQNPYTNSLTELGWIPIEVTETNTLVGVRLELTWNSVDYASEGSLHLTSPAGTEVTLYQSTATGPTDLEFTLYDFMDENMNGTWELYMMDSYGDGGHIVTDCTIYFGAVNGTDADDGLTIPTVLNGNYPNPFNPTTAISYSLNSDSDVTLEIYNIKGQLVKTLVNDVMKAGAQEAIWNGLDDSNNRVSSGVYFYKLNAGDYTSTKKMILLK